MPKIRNIIIFIAIAATLVLVYIFVVKAPSSDQANLVSSSDTTSTPSLAGSGVDTNNLNGTSSVAGNFLSLLLSVKTIKLDDSIFSDPAFIGLHDSSIILVPDATIGRPNPFAQFGVGDIVTPPTTTTGAPVNTTPTPTPITPPTTTGTPAKN